MGLTTRDSTKTQQAIYSVVSPNRVPTKHQEATRKLTSDFTQATEREMKSIEKFTRACLLPTKPHIKRNRTLLSQPSDRPSRPPPAINASLTSINPSNRKAVSMGPPAASGWNCTEDQGLVWWMMPSLVLSLALVKRVFQPSGSVEGSTANLRVWMKDTGGGNKGGARFLRACPLYCYSSFVSYFVIIYNHHLSVASACAFLLC